MEELPQLINSLKQDMSQTVQNFCPSATEEEADMLASKLIGSIVGAIVASGLDITSENQ